MSRTKYGTTVAAATAGLIWSLTALCPVAAADPLAPASPAVPCLSMIQQLAATPPSPPETAPDASSPTLPADYASNAVPETEGRPAVPALPGDAVSNAIVPPPASDGSVASLAVSPPAVSPPAPGPVVENAVATPPPSGPADPMPGAVVGMPTDLLCAGAAWALLSESSDGIPAEMPRVAETRDHRGEW